MDRSSKTVLDDAKIPRRTAGVTGILLDEGLGNGWLGLSAPKVEGVTVFVEEKDRLEREGMMAVVGLSVASVIWNQKGRAEGTPRTKPPTTHDASDNLVLILACPRECARCPSFTSPILTIPAPTRILAQLRR